MHRVTIAKQFKQQPFWKIVVGVPLIYLPLVTTLPFAVLTMFLVQAHLKLIGAQGLKGYWDFVPKWLTHRYRNSEQLQYSTGARWYNLRGWRLYWVFNCKLYCPLSVAVFRYLGYLVMVVENWWCPFGHEKKLEYAEGAIDSSYWHLYKAERQRLEPEDRNNHIWNESSQGPGEEKQ
jgi:hypothetical protein